MEISANFAFLKQEFPQAAESASYAERHIGGRLEEARERARLATGRGGAGSMIEGSVLPIAQSMEADEITAASQSATPLLE